jgi:hypothetical protein
MNDKAELIHFYVVPMSNRLEEAEQRLRSAGFDQVKRSPDGQRLQVVAQRDLVEKAIGYSLVEKRRQSLVGRVKQEVIFPVAPNYYQSSAQERKGF